MPKGLRDKLDKETFPWIILCLGIVYLAVLASSIPENVFFSADGGLKFIMIRQRSQGEAIRYLSLHQAPWVRAIWAQGFFPLKPPFVYDSPQGYLFSFPPAFQWMNAPLYKAFGYRGLYIIPLASTLILWYWFLWLLRICKVPDLISATALFTLIFCSPLTVYGATYWEHMPAVLLLFAGIVFLTHPPANRSLSALLGLMAGLAVWLRPEAMLIDLACIISLVFFWRFANKGQLASFTLGISVPIVAFFVFNRITYGSWLGIHAEQMLTGSVSADIIKPSIKSFLKLNWNLTKTFSFSLLLIPVIYASLARKVRLSDEEQMLLTVILSFCLVSPWMLPNTGGSQWGPRYFLAVIPAFLVLLSLAGKAWVAGPVKKGAVALGILLIPALIIGFFMNTVWGGLHVLRMDHYQKMAQPYQYLTKFGRETIVINAHYTAMEMGALFQERNFFLADDNDRLRRLFLLLKQDGIHEITYVYSENSDPPPKELEDFLAPYHCILVQCGAYYIGNMSLY